jgi:DNA polymerase III alpha subunit
LNESSAVPDIDIDIDTQRREEVIQYVYEKYGEEHAAMVCTYVTFRSRNAIREVGKVFGFPPHILDRMAKSVSGYGPAHATTRGACIAKNERSEIEGEAPRALPVEGATRAP